MRVVAALAAGGLLLALAGCAPSGDPLSLCAQQMDADLASATNASATEWQGGQVEGEERVYEYTATLTLGEVEVAISCQVAATPDGFLLQDYDAETPAG
jgi:outer membrane lipoprotein-sorting protein